VAQPVVTESQRGFLAEARSVTMATLAPGGRPRLVPICLAAAPGTDEHGRVIVYSPIDEKPKASAEPRKLARLRDMLVLPEVTLLADRWSEDWSELGWLRAYGVGELLEPESHEDGEHAVAVALLREKYPQYLEHALEGRPIIRIALDRVVAWGVAAEP
jgi:coenzyme F420-0:L-glutamate ligase / coenzyme F420-1:gamma-L-glutamate ligase